VVGGWVGGGAGLGDDVVGMVVVIVDRAVVEVAGTEVVVVDRLSGDEVEVASSTWRTEAAQAERETATKPAVRHLRAARAPTTSGRPDPCSPLHPSTSSRLRPFTDCALTAVASGSLAADEG
jgi:hypothetical protein